MRFKPIALGLVLVIAGVAAAAFSLPPYPVVLPGTVDVVKGQPAELPIVIWNLRPKPISITYIGDCCSKPKEIELPAFSYQKVKIDLETKDLPLREVQKAATLQYKIDGRKSIEAYPYLLKVSAK